ncbi:MAG: HlyD family secretion protein [Synechococcus lacustris]
MTESNSPNSANSPNTPQANQTKATRSKQAELIIILAGGSLLVATAFLLINFWVPKSRDAIVEATPTIVRTPINGTIADMKVDTSDQIHAGEIIAVVENEQASDLDGKRLATSLDEAEAELEGRQKLMVASLERYRSLQQDAFEQHRLEGSLNNDRIQAALAKLRRSQEELLFSERDLKRQAALLKAGAISETVYDRALTNLSQNKQDIYNLEQELAQQRTLYDAANQNLTLTTTRSNSDPNIRLQEAELSLKKRKAALAVQARLVQGLKGQLETAKHEYQLHSKRKIIIPPNSKANLVWKVTAREGDSVVANQSIAEVIDCNKRFITTYVNESELRNLNIGSPARIQLIGQKLKLNGDISFIRSGIGRVQLGEDQSQLLPINLARESQVRVRISNNIASPPSKFCYVGYTGRVLFRK